MLQCKHCGGKRRIKKGKDCGKQRYLCKDCGRYFRRGDKRTDGDNKKKYFCVFFYKMKKKTWSMREIGKLFRVHHTLVYRWVHEFPEPLPESHPISSLNKLPQKEIDEMWRKLRENGYYQGIFQIEGRQSVKQLKQLWKNKVFQR